ncbi:MAG: DUF2785 domain-containing protein [Pseudomonadota bacterium]
MLKTTLPTATFWLVASLCTLSLQAEARDCLPHYSRAAIDSLAVSQFSTEPGEIDALAMALSGCLGESDPYLRDDIGYTGLATLLRSGRVSAATVRSLDQRLRQQLQSGDDNGYRQPFAALALAEVVRADRIDDLLSADERDAIVRIATAYVRDIRDYRGFSDHEGWRHGVAHGADLLMQLALNPHLDDQHIPGLVDAALSQVSAYDNHAYIHGESRRLARPVLFAAQREVLTADDWTKRFNALTQPDGRPWQNAYRSESSLARLHNTRTFLLNVYASIAESENPIFEPLKQSVRGALASLP